MRSYSLPSSDSAKRAIAQLGAVVLLLAVMAFAFNSWHRTAPPSAAANAVTGRSAASELKVQTTPTTVAPDHAATDTTVETSTSGGGAKPNTQVRINNQPVAVPDNGTLHKTVPTNNGNTSVDISVDSNTTGSSTSNSSSSIQLDTTSTSESSVNISE